MQARNKQSGFTIIELMVTLVVMGILLSLGVPSFVNWIRDSRMDTATRSLAGALKLGRSEAVSQQSVITVQRGTNTVPGNWANGAHIYTDAQPLGNTDFSPAAPDNDVLIKNIDFNLNGITAASNNDNNFVSFDSAGRLNEAGIAPPLVITLCDDSGDPEGRTVTVNAIGRVSIGIDAAGCP